MIEYIKENFTHRVDEDKNGMKVILTNNSEVVPECVIWFERAKSGWSKKPVKVNNYIIVDAYLIPLFEFFSKYMGMGEDKYEQLRLDIIYHCMGIMDDHTNPDNK